MKKLIFPKVFILFTFLLLFSNYNLLSQRTLCKVQFCNCCAQDFYYEIYHAGPDTLVGTFNTDEDGCSHTGTAGVNLVAGMHYFVLESNPLCDQIKRTYFTACVCDEELVVITVPCCDPADNNSNTKQNYKPTEFKLSQNFPNPFNPITKIDFEIPDASNVRITIYDVTGRVVEEILNDNVPAGYHSVTWNANNKNVSSGVYFYKLEAGSFTDEKKMVLIK